MKTKVLITILFLCIPVYSFGADIIIPIVHHATTAACADSSCVGFDICQNFEGAGYDNSETWDELGGADEDDTTAPVGRDSQQIELIYTTESGRSYASITSRTAYYGHFIYWSNDATPASDKTIFALGDGTPLTVINATDGTFGISCGGDYSYTVSTMSNSTVYHVWVYAAKGTGADAACSLGFSTGRVEVTAGDAFASISTGTNTANIDAVQLICDDDAASACYFDQVLLKSTSIGTVCE